MHARATLLEIDTLRVAVDAALATFETDVLPGLREAPGYEGALVLSNEEGKGLIVTFWATPEGADTGEREYLGRLAEYMTLFRSAPGRERYEVALAELPAFASG
ncbi:MAG TPA: hypothetical protein VF152_06005 [Acidimicrobiia bacterium]